MSEQILSKGIEELVKKVDNPDDAVELTKKMDKMINSNKSSVLIIAYEQGKIFNKFKTDNKFISAVSAFKIIKTTINFKIDILKFIDMYPKIQTSYISFNDLKNNFRVIKEV